MDYYYKKYPTLRPVSGLMKMAAHVVLTGYQFNSGSVDGLEMVICNGEGFTRVSNEECQRLAEDSQTLHKLNDAHFRA